MDNHTTMHGDAHYQEQKTDDMAMAEHTDPGMLSMHDPENPQNWPLTKKFHACLTAWTFTFVLLFGLTSYSVAIPAVVKAFDVSMTTSILGFSLYLFGIFFAPITTPHLSEKFGRLPVYLVALPTLAAFEVGAGFSKSFAALAACRFFAGFCGGPVVVLIEGTFADVWSAERTGSYYVLLTSASYGGAAFGPLISAFVVANTSWRWAQYVTAMLALAALLISVGTPETYPRQIIRNKARRAGNSHALPPAASGVSVIEMARITLVEPCIMLVTEPLVTIIALYLGFNFGVLFSFFITVPVVLQKVYKFKLEHIGLSLLGPLGGVFFAAATIVIIDRLSFAYYAKKFKGSGRDVPIEHRMFPAMIGGVFMTAALFWVGWSAKPPISVVSPILGVFLFVWGSMMVLSALVSYLFDAYPARNTLSALTAGALTRVALAGVIALVIIQMFDGLTPPWALSTFGFIGAALMFIPVIVFLFGAKLRAKSRYSKMADSMPAPLGKAERSGSSSEGLIGA